MKEVIYDTEHATFTFRLDDIVDRVSRCSSEYNLDDVIQILHLLTRSRDPCIKVPKENSYFGFVAIDLITLGKGSVHCRICNESYDPHQLKLVPVGHGTSPIHPNIMQSRRFFKGIFKLKRSRNPPMFGGKAYECPRGHEVIARVMWRT